MFRSLTVWNSIYGASHRRMLSQTAFVIRYPSLCSYHRPGHRHGSKTAKCRRMAASSIKALHQARFAGSPVSPRGRFLSQGIY